MTERRVPRYGVNLQSSGAEAVDRAVEGLKLVGYAVVDGGYDEGQLKRLSRAFDGALAAMYDRFGGEAALAEIDEDRTLRAPLSYDRLFLDLAKNEAVHAICRRLIGGYFILNQQNGIINPPGGQRYNQGAYHRDLPYQHFTSSRPLAINALFCLDEFTSENGATFVVPGSHKEEAFPSDETVAALQRQVEAPAGSFIVLDCMAFHSGGVNATRRPRRAVNHVFTIPPIRQQIDLPAMLGDGFTADPDERRLLGYEVRALGDVEAYYAQRRSRLSG